MESNMNPRTFHNSVRNLEEYGKRYSRTKGKSYGDKCLEDEKQRTSEYNTKVAKRPKTKQIPKDVPMINNQSATDVVQKSSEKMTAATSANKRHSEKKGLPSLYECASSLKKKVKLINYSDNLYCYNGRCYDIVRDSDVAMLYRKLVDNRVGLEKSMHTIMQLYKFLCIDPEICIGRVPTDYRCAVLKNGIYNVEDGVLYDHTSDIVTFSFVNALYVENEECPAFDKFIEDVTGGDSILIKRLWMTLGYLLMQTNEAKVFFIMGEAPDSGKSLFGNFVESLFEERYVSSVALNDFNKEFSLAPIVGAALNVSLDLPASKLNSMAVSRLKMLTGGDAININQKYVQEFKHINRTKFLFASNAPIAIAEEDEAFWKRVIYLPFNNSVPRGQQDRGLKYAFVKEKNAIVSKALKYARKLVKNDFEFPTTPQIDCKIDEWKGKTVLSVESFLQNCCDLDSEYRGELMENLYSAYESYCENSSCVSLNRHRFKQYLEKHVGLRHWKMRDGGISSQSAFKGIRIV